MQKISRRTFLGQASCAAVGSTAMLSSFLNLKFAGSAAAQNIDHTANDYRALVCIFLAGGNDSYNMLVPRSTNEYLEYAKIRADLALPQNQLLPINPLITDGREYGLHPGFGPIQELFEQGDLTFLSNVGTLVEPTSLDTFKNKTAKLPLGLFSHADQIAHWQTALPDQRSAIGWAGRMADLMAAGNAESTLSMNVSLSGNNVFQTGKDVISFSLPFNYEKGIGIKNYGKDNNAFNRLKTTGINSLLDAQYEHLLEQSYADAVVNSIEANENVSTALAEAPTLQTSFSESPLSQRLKAIAKMISVREKLGLSRQTFFVNVGGWDHHDEVLLNHETMFPMVSGAMDEFNTVLKELDVHNNVCTFTASDFGRTLTSNGKGSDHGWGGNQMIMGGPVKGRMVHGSYPSLYAGNPLDTGRGRLIPTTSVDEYFAELALWFGVSRGDIDSIFPNLARFFLSQSGSMPIGFLNT